MENLLSALLIIITGLFLFSCSDSSSEPEMSKEIIKGRVLDSDGNPVKNAKIVFNYHGDKYDLDDNLIENDVIYEHIMPDSTYAVLYAANEGRYKIWFSDIRTGKTISTIVDTTLTEGNHRFKWDFKNDDGKFFLNGFYNYNIEIASIEHAVKQSHFYSYRNLNEDEIEYLTETDENGKFEIAKDKFSIGESIKSSDEVGNKYKLVISEYIRLEVIKNDYKHGYKDSVNCSLDEYSDDFIITLKKL